MAALGMTVKQAKLKAVFSRVEDAGVMEAEQSTL